MQVAFGGSTIKRFLKLQDIENNEYHAFLRGKIDYQEVLRTITVPGTQWKVTDGKPITFPSIGLTKECKAWYYFLATRLMPVRHFSDITKERDVLLYALVTEMSIDLGKFLSFHIMQCAKHPSASLYYPSLITT